jgi:hypothetical protein
VGVDLVHFFHTFHPIFVGIGFYMWLLKRIASRNEFYTDELFNQTATDFFIGDMVTIGGNALFYYSLVFVVKHKTTDHRNQFLPPSRNSFFPSALVYMAL